MTARLYNRHLKKLSKNVFLNFKSPSGRGNISKIKANNKYIFLVDETYNSNPLSLKTAIENFDKINVNAARKHLVLGDMLELGRHSLRQHRLISKDINKTKIHKVYVYGKYIRQTFVSQLKVGLSYKITDKDIIYIEGFNRNANSHTTNDGLGTPYIYEAKDGFDSSGLQIGFRKIL